MRRLACKATAISFLLAGSLIAAASGNKKVATDRTPALRALSIPAKADKFQSSIPIAWEPEALIWSKNADFLSLTDSGAELKVAYQEKPIKLSHFDFSLLKRFIRIKK